VSTIVKIIGIAVIIIGIILLFISANNSANDFFKPEMTSQDAIDNLSVLVAEIVVMCFGIGIFAIGIRMKPLTN